MHVGRRHPAQTVSHRAREPTMSPRTRDATHQATNRQRRRLQAQDRLDRDRRQAQPAAEALHQTLDALGLPEDLVIEIEGRLRSQKKRLGTIVGVMFPPLFGSLPSMCPFLPVTSTRSCGVRCVGNCCLPARPFFVPSRVRGRPQKDRCPILSDRPGSSRRPPAVMCRQGLIAQERCDAVTAAFFPGEAGHEAWPRL